LEVDMETLNEVCAAISRSATRKFMDISTGHITEEDADLLRRGFNNQLYIIKYDFGDFVLVEEGDAFLNAIVGFGYSGSFLKIIIIAQTMGMAYVRFNADAPMLDGLERYEW